MAASADLLVRIRADASQATAALKSIQTQVSEAAKGLGINDGLSTSIEKAVVPTKNLESALNKAWMAGAALAGVGAAIGGAFVGALNVGATLETAFAKIQGLTGASAGEIDFLRGSVDQLTAQFPKTAVEMANALYPIESLGIRGAGAIDVLTASLRASAAGLGDTSVISDAITSMIAAYKLPPGAASGLADQLVAAVTAGKMDPAALAGALGKVLPLAASTGVGSGEILANVAAFSRIGGNPDEAATAIRGVLSTFDKGNKQSANALKLLGLTPEAVRAEFQSQGLAATLTDLVTRAGGDDAKMNVLAGVVGNIRALTDVLAVAKAQPEAYAAILDQVTNSAGRAASANAIAAQTMKAQWGLVVNALEAVQERLSGLVAGPIEKILPVVAGVLRAFVALPAPVQAGAFALLAVAGVVATLAGGLILLAPGLVALPEAFAAIGAIAGGTMIPALVAAAPVILAVVVALGAVAFVVTHWDQAKAAVAGALNAIAAAIPTVLGVLDGMFAPIVLLGTLWVKAAEITIGQVGAIRDAVVSAVTDIIAWLGRLLAGIGAALGPIASVVGDALGGVAAQFADKLGAAVSGGQGGLAGLANPLQSALRGAASDVGGAGNPFAGLLDQAQKTADGVKSAFSGVPGAAPNGAGGGEGGPNNGTNAGMLWQPDDLEAGNARLQTLRDNLDAVRTASQAAASQGVRPFAAQIDAVDKSIAKIELARLEKTYDRLQKHPARTPGAQLGRLNLEKQILEREQTIATPFGASAAAAKDPRVLAAEALVKQQELVNQKLADQKKMVEDIARLYKDYAPDFNGRTPFETSAPSVASAANPMRNMVPLGGGGTVPPGAGEPGQFGFPSVAGSTTNTTTTTLNQNGPIVGQMTVNKQADEQSIVDVLNKWLADLVSSSNAGTYAANSASSQLAGVRKSN